MSGDDHDYHQGEREGEEEAIDQQVLGQGHLKPGGTWKHSPPPFLTTANASSPFLMRHMLPTPLSLAHAQCLSSNSDCPAPRLAGSTRMGSQAVVHVSLA
ncbi:UNVERIFIED_CONTAM: hypothetical protein K2H54_059849 [Gekko kuhli]